MPRRTITITSCDICGATDANEFWADVMFRSKMYEYDAGTNPQNHNWTLCRSCKVKLLDFMDEAAKAAKDKAPKAKPKRPKVPRKPKAPKEPATCFERVPLKGLSDGDDPTDMFVRPGIDELINP